MNSSLNRRAFLKQTAAAGVGVGIANLRLAQASTTADDRPLNVVVARLPGGLASGPVAGCGRFLLSNSKKK